MVCCGVGTAYLVQPFFSQNGHNSPLEQLFQFFFVVGFVHSFRPVNTWATSREQGGKSWVIESFSFVAHKLHENREWRVGSMVALCSRMLK